MKTEWTEFGLHDVRCQVPADWDPTHIEGSYHKGYVRLDDVRGPRLEIRWERPRRRVLLAGTVDKHIKLVTREARKSREELRVERRLPLAGLPFEEYEFFSYKNHIEAAGLVSRCGECGRVMILRVFAGDDRGPLHETAARIFQSLRDHPADGKSRWNLYGLCFDVPEGYRLSTFELKTGRLRFDFAHRGSQIMVARAALAHMVLKDRTLEMWMDEALPKLFRDFVVERTKDTFRGHSALVYTGRYKLRLRVFRLILRPWFLHCRLWYCETSDKIFVFRVVGPASMKNALENNVDLVYCH